MHIQSIRDKTTYSNDLRLQLVFEYLSYEAKVNGEEVGKHGKVGEQESKNYGALLLIYALSN